jgi:hypothetical protein
MPQRLQPALSFFAPMMGRAAGFHADKARAERREERQHILAPKRLGNNYLAAGITAVNLKNMLGEIDRNSGDRQ